MSTRFQQLDVYSALVEEAHLQHALFPIAEPGLETQQKVADTLGFCHRPETPTEVRIEERWEHEGLIGEVVSWSVGYGPRTQAWLFKPAQAKVPLPGVVALHDHGGFKFLGKEKVARGKEGATPTMINWWQQSYGGRPFANMLAKQGFAVLVHDTFLWGSRRFPMEVMPDWAAAAFSGIDQTSWLQPEIPYRVGEYNFSAAQHEHVVEKYCQVLGTTMAGVVAHEDRIAVNYLMSRPDVDADRLGCLGLSGGGARAALLQATHHTIRAAVIVGMMSTYRHLLDANIECHTWMFFPAGWARHGDWPDLAACRAPSPLLVQYDIDDELFTLEGMRAADRRLTEHYESVGSAGGYSGEFYPGPHKFDEEMQTSAFAWLSERLR